MTSPLDARLASDPMGSTGRLDRQTADGAGRLELIALIHVAVLVIFTSWDFGGETDFARTAISWWGTLAVPIIASACLRQWKSRDGLPAALRWLWPLLLFDALVLISALNPSFTRASVGGVAALVSGGSRPGWPSSALPEGSLRGLWQFNAIYLSCFNIMIVVVRRRVLRALLFVMTVNTLLLAVMGTLQKLTNAPGLYFGLQPSPNTAFFASFIYHNHWGAWVLLSTAASLALVLYYSRRRSHDGPRHSPALFVLVATLFSVASVPLSASRSCTLLVLVLSAGALIHWITRLWRRRQSDGRSLAGPIMLAAVLWIVGVSGVYWLGWPIIETRLNNTRQQIEEIRLRGSLGSRQQLYGDTCRMARQKILFGWGLGSYATVFQIFNQQVSVEGWVPFYAQAHSDWLQAWAEVGCVGTALIILLAAVPLMASGPWKRIGAVPGCLLAGCGLLVLYAAVEFPFANSSVMDAFWLCFFAALRYHRLGNGRT